MPRLNSIHPSYLELPTSSDIARGEKNYPSTPALSTIIALVSLSVGALYVLVRLHHIEQETYTSYVSTHLRLEELEDQFRGVGKILAFLLSKRKEQDGRAALGGAGEAMRDEQRILIAEVTVPKANLRSAPVSSSTAVMAVSNGTQLVVEDAQDGWLKVATPIGVDAWISQDIVKLIDDK